MLRKTRLPYLFHWNSGISSILSSHQQLSTRSISLHSAYPSATSPLTMSLKQFTTETKGTEHDELYRYTSGRWLIDEDYQLSQRFVKFDISRLCRLAASLLDEKLTCIHVDKLEGKSSRAFLLTMDDGRQLVAKTPYPISGPAFYTTASEVATMKFRTLYLLITSILQR